MSTIVCGPKVNEALSAWVCKTLKLEHTSTRGSAIGLVGSKGLLAVALYEDFSGTNLFTHIAAMPGKRWMNKRFLWTILHYPFVQLGCKRITAGVPESNLDCRRFVEQLGFELEARLKEAVPDGDLLVYKLTADNPKLQRILEMGQKEGFEHGQAERAKAA